MDRLAEKGIPFEQQVDRTILQRDILTAGKKSDIVHIPSMTLDTSGSSDIPFVWKTLRFPSAFLV